MNILFACLAVLVIFATLAALVPRTEWWFRGFDFPRNQIIVLGLIALTIAPLEWRQLFNQPLGWHWL